MKIAYTKYAEETLGDRKIPKERIEKAVMRPEEVVNGKKGRRVAHRTFGSKLLRVVFEGDAKAYIVITAYYTKTGRYMRK